jgi:hypothetical protein
MGLDDRLRKLEQSIKPRDPAAERRFRRDAALLDTIAAIIANNPRWDGVAAQVAEHNPELDDFAAQLEVKRRLIESDPRGGPELAALLVAGAQRRER